MTFSDGVKIVNATVQGVGTILSTAFPVAAPEIALGVAAGKALMDLIQQIADAHGASGLAEAKALLQKLRDEGPSGISDPQLALDDASIEDQIKAWYKS